MGCYHALCSALAILPDPSKAIAAGGLSYISSVAFYWHHFHAIYLTVTLPNLLKALK